MIWILAAITLIVIIYIGYKASKHESW